MATEPVKGTDPRAIRRSASSSSTRSATSPRSSPRRSSSPSRELKVSVKHGGVGVGLFAGAAFLGLLAVIMLSVSFAYFLHWNGAGLDLHWAFLVVFGVYLLIAGLLAFIGLKQVKQVKAPERAIEQGKQIPQALKGQG